MSISWLQAGLLGLFACLCSNSCMAGQAVGNYTIGRPLVGGLICGLILGNVPLGIACGVATQLVYIALVTPGGTVAADVRAISYIGIPLAMVAISSRGLNPFSSDAANLAKSLGTLVGAMLPCVGIAILLRQIVNTSVDFIPFLVGFTLAASLHLNLVSITVVSLLFAMIFYEVEMAQGSNNNGSSTAAASASDDDEEEEDI